MLTDDDLVPMSALQHYLFCPRQCALIHVEQAWAENSFTAEGRVLHEATGNLGGEIRRGVRVVTSMPLASHRLGVSGIADLVELHAMAGGRWMPFPVEYKRGKPKAHRADEVQLCAQAMALEEMFAVEILEGALFYGETRRRTTVILNDALRSLTLEIAESVRCMRRSGETPAPDYKKSKCGRCSLLDLCQSRRLTRTQSASSWLMGQLREG